MDVKHFSAAVEARATAPGKFKALVCTFGVVDKGHDVVHRGAFTASLARWRGSKRLIPVLFNHLTDDPHAYIGAVSPHDSQETERGLIVSGHLYTDEAHGNKVYQELKRGTLSEWSFGCLVESSRPRANGGRDLIRLDLFEVSPTLLAKGIGTETLMVASVPVALHTALTPAEQLAPYRARLDVAQRRVERARAR